MNAIDQATFARENGLLTPCPAECGRSSFPSERARRDLLAISGEPFWLCDWTEVVFLHLEVDAETLQREVPFQLDLYRGRAFVSLVAFTLTEMRPRFGGRLVRQLFKPFGTHRFLNVRTYVWERGQAGIYFLAEWLDAPWLNLLAGPLLYGLPFRCGRLCYHNQPVNGRVRGRVEDARRRLDYSGTVGDPPQRATLDSLDEFLVERYRAFTCRGDRRGWFPVWHEPWTISPLTMELNDSTLLAGTGDWCDHARLHSAHWSPRAGTVWMGWRRSLAEAS